jgi:hypothetical protein
MFPLIYRLYKWLLKPMCIYQKGLLTGIKIELTLDNILKCEISWIQHYDKTQIDRLSRLLKITNNTDQETEDQL